MANAVESGVVITAGNAETLACRIERTLQAVGESENVEALVIGLGAASLSFLLGYAIVILTKFPVGIFAIGLG
ncbi:MAG: hypothetical protein ACE5MG_04870 [Candidatus Methylomirabilales bacterium]